MKKTLGFNGLFLGLSSGLTWAIDTILIGMALSSTTFMSFGEVALAAPLISTFLHDFFSSIWMIIFFAFKGELFQAFSKFKTRDGMFVALAATLGGPVGMLFYVLSVQKIGPSFTAAISSFYPAVGAFFAFLILKDKLSLKNWGGLLISIIFIVLMSYSGDLLSGTKVSIGFIFVLLCVFGWGMESVVCAYGMKDDQVSPLQALLIRQVTSSFLFGAIIIPIFLSHSYTIQVAQTKTFWFIALIAFFGTVSYMFYYQAINLIGPVRAMGLNISYAAWAIFLDVLIFGADFSLKNFIFALFIMLGAILTVMENKKPDLDEKGKVLTDESDNISSRNGNTASALNKQHS